MKKDHPSPAEAAVGIRRQYENKRNFELKVFGKKIRIFCLFLPSLSLINQKTISMYNPKKRHINIIDRSISLTIYFLALNTRNNSLEAELQCSKENAGKP